MQAKQRPYRILADHMDVYRFMLEIYEKDWRNGVPAPFLEYALSSSWMDVCLTHRFRIWEDAGRIVALCFYEKPATDTYFSLRPGYESLADEMVHYALENMPNQDNEQMLILFGGQDALMEAARKAGCQKKGSRMDWIYEYDRPLDYPLPEGFRFVPQNEIEIAKISECCYKGFDHEAEEGPWDGDSEHHLHLLQAPHATPQYPVVIQNEKGEYVCYAGMWWTPENHLAYMEPLCTVPEYRRKGLAAAALSEMYRRMKPLGATHMTGGGDVFYEKIGYRPMIEWTYWKK